MPPTNYIIPNQHVALIHFPIALLMIGVLLEIGCAVAARGSSARVAARWMICVGAALGWVALYSGIFAMRHIAIAGSQDLEMATWAQLRAESPVISHAAIWETLRTHLLVALASVAAANLVVIAWVMAGERLRRAIYVPGLLLLFWTCCAIGFTAWNGGELVYWHDATGIAKSAGIDGESKRAVSHSIASFVPPLETHVTLAGLVTGMALVTWAVASRPRLVSAEVRAAAAALPSDPFFAAFQPGPVDPIAHKVPDARLGWMTAFAIAATGFFGWWSLAQNFETWSPGDLLTAILDTDGRTGAISRRLAHAIGAGTLLLSVLLTAYVGRFSKRSRLWPMLVGLLLLAAIIAQTWLGMLLLLDGNSGSVVKPNAGETVVQPAASGA